MVQRLRSHVGETMTETLVSILVSALALTVLATVIATSVNIVKTSREHMKEFYEAESDMAAMATGTSAQLEIEVPLEAGDDTIDVTAYTSDDASNIVYYERSSTP